MWEICLCKTASASATRIIGPYLTKDAAISEAGARNRSRVHRGLAGLWYIGEVRVIPRSLECKFKTYKKWSKK